MMEGDESKTKKEKKETYQMTSMITPYILYNKSLVSAAGESVR
jgi:hypothetical protein